MTTKHLTHPELERRLLHWTGSSSVPRYPFFESHSSLASSSSTGGVVAAGAVQDLPRWFADIELASQDCKVQAAQYPDVAIYFLRGDLKEVMKDRRGVYLGLKEGEEGKERVKAGKKEKREKNGWDWDWEDFKEDLRRVVGEAAKIMSSPQISSIAGDAMAQLRKSHPFIASSIGLSIIIGGTAVLLPALGLMAVNSMNRRQLNGPVGVGSPRIELLVVQIFGQQIKLNLSIFLLPSVANGKLSNLACFTHHFYPKTPQPANRRIEAVYLPRADGKGLD
ncbi:hypothetical protein B0H34DRAFT_670700 [Crassisporium funariophilum]|nr:hypothetical protein B0H34DRAFT_670700 [Crassisporium funariophilum]